MSAPAPTLTAAESRRSFPPLGGYLAACTMGVPPRATTDALRADLENWAIGKASAREYDACVLRARASFAALVGLPTDRVAVGSQVSPFAAIAADGVPDDGEVLCVEGDFSSMVFPFLQHAHRSVTVRSVPLEALADAVTERTALVAYSVVQSATGAVADMAAVAEAARRSGARVFADLTQALGWLPVDSGTFDASVCHAYKWLCCPRGAAFFTVSAEYAAELRPLQAGWYSGHDPWLSCYGPAMQLAADARCFDVSPAWPAWPGTAVSLEHFERHDSADVYRHTSGLGDALADALGTADRRGSAIVTWPDADGEHLARLTAAGITASGRAGRARVAFHVWNDEDDVERVLRAIRN